MTRRPIFAVAWIWVAGYAVAHWVGGEWEIPLSMIVGLAVVAGVWWLVRLPGRTALTSLLIFALAFAYYSHIDRTNVTRVLPPDTSMSEMDGRQARLTGVINEPVKVDGDRVSLVLLAREWHWEGEEPIRTKEKVQVFIRLLHPEEQQRAREWGRGDRVELTGDLRLPNEAANFGAFDYRAYLRNHRIHWTVSLKGTDGLVVEAATGWNRATMMRSVDRFRDLLSRHLDGLFSGEDAGFMKGMLLGIRDDLPPALYDQFSRLGMTHILAISGLHVGIFAGAVWFVLGRLRLPRETALTISAAILPVYVLLTGASPSVVRAGIMGVIALVAARYRLLKDGLQIIGGTALAMLIWNPLYLHNISFQLSFLVTCGLLIGVPAVNRLLPIRNIWLKNTFSVTLTAQVVSFPVTVFYFNQFNLLSFLANLLLVPVFGAFVIPAGYAAMALGAIWLTAGEWLARLVSWVNRLGFALIDLMDAIPWVRLIWPTPSLWWILAYYGLVSLLLYLGLKRSALVKSEREGVFLWPDRRGIQKLGLAMLSVSVGLAGLMAYGYSPNRLHERGIGTVAFLNVGQGDAALIRTPEGKHVLIDGGGNLSFHQTEEDWKMRRDPFETGKDVVVPLLKQRGVHRLDVVVITHLDADHIGGLQAVLDEIPVGAILFNGTVKSGPTVTRLFQTALDLGIPLFAPVRGDVIRLGPTTSLTILAPDDVPGQPLIREEDKQNDWSLVCLLEMNGRSFLFAGDVEERGERSILEALAVDGERGALKEGRVAGIGPATTGAGDGMIEGRIDVMKVAHHGSKTSTTPEWLGFWRPAAAVISVGNNNPYRHPHETVLDRLHRFGAQVYRTDVNGEIQFRVSSGGLVYRVLRPDREGPVPESGTGPTTVDSVASHDRNIVPSLSGHR